MRAKRGFGVITKACLNCESNFQTRTSEVSRGGGKYCSHRCSMIYSQKSGGLNRKTGTMIHRGYILEWAPNHPNHVKGYVLQHRLVVEKSIGRLLEKTEVVHHKNEIKSDNRIENLEILSAHAHRMEHSKYRIRIKDSELSFSRACEQIKKNRSVVRRFAKRHSLSHQEAINHFLKYGRGDYEISRH